MSLSTQQAVIRSSEDVKDMLGDISKWEDEMREQDQILELKSKKISESNTDKAKKAVEFKDLGNKQYAEKNYHEAVRLYSEAIELDKDNHIFPANRAMAYLKLEKYELAEIDCTNSLSIEPNYVKALLRRASARLHAKNLEGAAKDYNQILSLEPSNKEAAKELDKIKSELKKKTSTLISKKSSKTKLTKEQLTKPGKHKVSFLDSPIEEKKDVKLRKLIIRDVSSYKSIPIPLSA